MQTTFPLSTDQQIADLEAWASIPGVDRIVEDAETDVAELAGVADVYDDPASVAAVHAQVVAEADAKGHPLPSTAPPESCDRCGSADRTLHLADVRIPFGSWHCVSCSIDADVASGAVARRDAR